MSEAPNGEQLFSIPQLQCLSALDFALGLHPDLRMEHALEAVCNQLRTLIDCESVEVLPFHEIDGHQPDEQTLVRTLMPENGRAAGVLVLKWKNGGIFSAYDRALVERLAAFVEKYLSDRGLQQRVLKGLSGKQSLLTRLQVQNARLQALSERYQLSLASAQLGVWDWNILTDRVVWSESPRHLLGFPLSACQTLNELLERVHSDERQLVRAEIDCAIHQKRDLSIQFRFFVSPEKEIWIRARGRIFFDLNGKPIRMAGTVMDVTDSRTTEEALRQSEAHYRFLFESNPQPMWVFDRDTLRFLEVNAAAISHYGFTREEFLRMTLLDIRPHSEHMSLRNALSGRREQTFSEGRFRHRKKAGEMVDVLVRGHDIVFDGRPARLVSVADISEQVRTELEIKKAQRRSEEASQAKSAFVAGISHEIRTPLSAIVGFTELLRDGATAKRDHDNYVDIIARNCAALGLLIDQVLDLSKIEAGKLKLESLQFQPRRLIQDVIELLQNQARQKNLQLVWSCADSVPEAIESDPNRLRQILVNLVGNAIKFTATGSVSIRLERLQRGATGQIYVWVSDTGPGIAPERVEHLFKSFSQGADSIQRQFGGTGLGLVLSRQLARALGGDITLEESRLGLGTTFLLRFPEQRVEGAIAPCAPSVERSPQIENEGSALQGSRILVVEDSPDNQFLLQRILSRAGARVDVAENGATGVEKALQNAYDLVLMDIQMPVMDGYTAMEQLARKQYPVPVLALTANALRQDQARCTELGFRAFVTKPIQPVSFIRLLKNYLASPSQPAPNLV